MAISGKVQTRANNVYKILRYLEKQGRPVTISNIAGALSMPYGKVYYAMQILIHWGYVSPAPVGFRSTKRGSERNQEMIREMEDDLLRRCRQWLMSEAEDAP